MPAISSDVQQGRHSQNYKVTLSTSYDYPTKISSRVQLYHVRPWYEGGDLCHNSNIITGQIIYSWISSDGEIVAHTDNLNVQNATFILDFPLPSSNEGQIPFCQPHSCIFRDIHAEGEDCAWDGLDWTYYFDLAEL